MIFRIIYAQPLKTIIVTVITMLIVWTIIGTFILKNKKIWYVINRILTVLSLIAILYSTIINRTTDSSYTMPFIRTIEHIQQQPELIREMTMNAFLFFPFGLTASFTLSSCLNDEKTKSISSVLITILSALLLSTTIELIQYLSNFGNCELSDIVMNTLGAAIGSVSYLVSSRLRR